MSFYTGEKSKNLTDYILSFNSTLRKLTSDLVNQFPNDAVAARIKKRVALAVSEAPVNVIEQVGIMLYGYHEQIYGNDVEFFLKNDYEEEFNSSTNSDKKNMASHILPKVKEAWRKSAEDKQKMYLQCVQGLLDDYLDYLCLKNKK